MSREIKFRAWDPFDRKVNGIKRGKGWHRCQGYVMQKAEYHPSSNKRGYVQEHRLIIENHMKRFLKPDEIVHHKNHIRDDNSIDNLEIFTDQKRHASAHAEVMKRDEKSKTWISDPVLSQQKFRLLNKNTGLMEIKTLANLINTTFRRGQFEFRGRFSGLKDKNGKEIYEGDVLNMKDHVRDGSGDFRWAKGGVIFNDEKARFEVNNFPMNREYFRLSSEVLGNIHQNKDLLK